MPKYNFDQIVNRRGSGALKTDSLKERFGREDLIPLWVADMDFMSPPAITEAIIDRAKHGIFGYACCHQAYFNSIISWTKRIHNWDVKQEWIEFIPGIVKGIAFTIDCFSTEQDSVIIQPPIYPPFKNVPTAYHRNIVNNPLVLENGQYKMDMEDLKSKITPNTKILILCNPHNPGGIVWDRQTLIELAEICYDNNVLVISDEIHSDLAFEGRQHIPFASVSDKAAEISITFMAPSKTFNIAGIVSSFVVIINEELRKKFFTYLQRSELCDGHLFAYLAAEVAYNECEDWLIEAKQYIWENIKFVDNYLKENIPQIKAIVPQASFLIWLDCRELNLSQDKLVSFFINKAYLALNNGVTFGEEEGRGFMRLNVGSPRSILEKALENLKKAVDELK